MGVILPIDKMSTEDRIKAMEELWDALSHEEKELESPDWHKDILNARREKIESGSAKFITIEDLKKQFKK
ncbi:MAG: addiction module protein [Planctomycetota bacterium]|jgi:putative addiction module component (TIGR02574 family)